MTRIYYQGRSCETDAPTVKVFLKSRSLADVSEMLVEYKGEVYGPGFDLSTLALDPDAELNVFHVVAGG